MTTIRELVLREWVPRLVHEAMTGDLRAQAALVQVTASIGSIGVGEHRGVSRGDLQKALIAAVEEFLSGNPPP